MAGVMFLDPAPLLQVARRRVDLPDRDHGELGCGVTDAHLAQELGVTLRTIGRWRAGGCLTIDVADRCATSLGLHLLHIWPDVYERRAAR